VKTGFGILVGLLVLSLIPIPHIVAPEWTVQIVDADGRPVPGITVREESQEYSIEHREDERDEVSGDGGTVRFPARYLYVSVLQRVIGAGLSVAGTGVHASFGSHTYVFAFGKGLEGQPDKEWFGVARTMTSKIVLHPCSVQGFCG
jgi:hypothetical protein